MKQLRKLFGISLLVLLSYPVYACNVSAPNLGDKVDVKKAIQKHLLMKVVVKMLDRDVSSTIFTNSDQTTSFYIRTAYNSSKDIILTNYINGNQILSFKEAFVGDNTLSDGELMTSTYLVSRHTDSTAPLMHAETVLTLLLNIYWKTEGNGRQ